jgi:hypothetical protein
MDQVETLANDQNFFHWDLEFPEIFFERNGRPLGERAGFDAVVGNPPYVRQERFTASKPYLKDRYVSYNSVADLYTYFFERGLELLQMNGRLGFISSGTFARSNSAKPFRAYLPTASQMEEVIDFGENQPFRGAEMVRPTIAVMRKGAGNAHYRSLFIEGKIPPSLDQAMEQQGTDAEQRTLQRPEWTFQAPVTTRLADRIFAGGAPLKEVVGENIYRGVTTGDNDVFVIDEDTKQSLIQQDTSSGALIKPLLAGQDLRPWYYEDMNRHLLFVRRGTDIDRYPAVKDFLAQFRAKLEPKPTDWPTGKKWAGRKAGEYEWFEIQDTVDYFRKFEKPKILFPDIANLPRFSWDDTGVYLNNAAYIIPDVDPSLLALLQSRVIWFAFSQMSQPLRERSGRWQYRFFRQFVYRIPLPELSDTEKRCLKTLAQRATSAAKERYELHQSARSRIKTDLGVPSRRLNQRLGEWWKLDFSGVRAEVKKVFKQDMPVRERDEWAAWLADRQGKHAELTERIRSVEEEINRHVYELFDLSSADVEVIERSTKYLYGEV